MNIQYVKGMVSVIIPCYNNAPYLRKCIDSVLNQTYKKLELIVVDDGSTDNPELIIDSYSDQRIRPLIRLPHKGVSTARNEGIQKATGEFIIFIDGDDWVESNHIEALMQGLDKCQCSMIMMSIDYPDRIETNQFKSEFFRVHSALPQQDFHLLFENYFLSSPCDKIYRTELVKENSALRFDNLISYAEDLLFNLEYFSSLQSVALIPATTYHYVKHAVSGTTRFHKNTSYSLGEISAATYKAFNNHLTPKSKVMLMRHYVWGIINVLHRDSNLGYNEAVSEIRQITATQYYKDTKPYINQLGLSRCFQFLLRLGNPQLLYFFLSLK